VDDTGEMDSFPEDNFPTIIGLHSVSNSHPEEFLNDFLITFQNGGQKWDPCQCQSPFPGGAF